MVQQDVESIAERIIMQIRGSEEGIKLSDKDDVIDVARSCHPFS